MKRKRNQLEKSDAEARAAREEEEEGETVPRRQRHQDEDRMDTDDDAPRPGFFAPRAPRVEDDVHPPKRPRVDPWRPIRDKPRTFRCPSPPFQTLCSLLDALSGTKDKKRKRQLFNQWMRTFGRNDLDHYPWMRLLCCDVDLDRRGAYSVKEQRLARVLVRAMGIQGSDAEELKNWRRGRSERPRQQATKQYVQRRARADAGNQLSDRVEEVLARRGWRDVTRVPTSKDYETMRTTASKSFIRDKLQTFWTVDDCNRFLDTLATIPKRDEAFASHFASVMGPGTLSRCEVKWLIRIILKALHCNCSHTTFLGLYHARAVKLHQAMTDLKVLIDGLQGYLQLPPDKGHYVTLFDPFRPMLAKSSSPGTKRKGGRDGLRVVRSAIRKARYALEDKFDGWRILIHYQRGGKIMYFSRKMFDHTSKHDDLFNDHVRNALSRIDSCILDGEMLVYDTTKGCHMHFGRNASYAIDRNHDQHFSFKCFDVLYLNGEGVMNRSYDERKKLLEEWVDSSENFFGLVPSEPVTDMEQVKDAIEEAVRSHNEGVILKRRDSTYELGARDLRWIKAKPSFFCSEDLLVLGGFYGTKFGRNSISHFLMGVIKYPGQVKAVVAARAKVKECQRTVQRLRGQGTMTFATQRRSTLQQDSRATQAEQELARAQQELQMAGEAVDFDAVVKVGSGFNKRELTGIQLKLTDKWFPHEDGVVPRFLRASRWREGGFKHTPNFWVNPWDSIVMQVHAQEVVESDKYACGKTLRFARCERMREDKDWTDVMTLKQLLERLEREQDTGNLDSMMEGGGDHALDRIARRQPVMLPQFRDTDTDDVVVESDIFTLPLSRRKVTAIERVKVLQRVLYPNQVESKVPLVGEYSSKICFCVLSDWSNCKKADVERDIVRLGGTKTQDARSADVLLVGKETIKLKAIQLANAKILADAQERLAADYETLDSVSEETRLKELLAQKDALSLRWFRDCVDGGKLVHLVPNKHLKLKSDRTARRIRELEDEFGDEYMKKIEKVEQLQQLMDSMPKVVIDDDPDVAAARLRSLRDAFRDKLEIENPTTFLHMCRFYFDVALDDGSEDSWTPTQLRLLTLRQHALGAGATDSRLEDPKLTHVIVHQDFAEDDPRMEEMWQERLRAAQQAGDVEMNRVLVVRESWLAGCFLMERKVVALGAMHVVGVLGGEEEGM